MEAPLPASEFWGDPSVVESFVALNTEPLPYEAALIERAVARAGPASARRVHVIGVGAGRELPAVRAAAPEAVIDAWDVSDRMVEACDRYVREAGLNRVRVGRADVAELRPVDGPADVVVAINAVLSYLTSAGERRRAAAAMAGLLRPGGSIAVVVQQRNGRPDWAAWFALRAIAARAGLAVGEPGDRRNHHGRTNLLVHHYTARELSRMLTDAGFVDVELRSLRAWGRTVGRRVRWRSPNPLLATAVLPPARGQAPPGGVPPRR